MSIEKNLEPKAARNIFTGQVTRRNMLAGGLGAVAVIAAPDLFYTSSKRADGLGIQAQAQSQSYFFLYGTLSTQPGPAVQAATTPAAQQASSVAPQQIAADLAALPVKSDDGSTLALVTKSQPQGGALVTLTLIDTATATTSSHGVLDLTNLPDGTGILVKPVFAGNSSTVVLVLSFTVPTNTRTITKIDPRTGGAMTLQAATWISHHALAYFDAGKGAFAGPYDLGDPSTLAAVTALANLNDLFLWTVDEAASHNPTKNSLSQPLVPRLSVFPIMSGKARAIVQAPGPWPQGEPVAALPTGDIVRLVSPAGDAQLCSAKDGSITAGTVDGLDLPSAKPGAITMQSRPDGMILVARPGIGRAVLADPASGFKTVSTVSFPTPASAGGTPLSKVVLSADGKTIYVAGDASTGGVFSYNSADGSRLVSGGEGTPYSAVYQLQSGVIAAIDMSGSQLSFFSPTLEHLTDAQTPLQVAAIF